MHYKYNIILVGLLSLGLCSCSRFEGQFVVNETLASGSVDCFIEFGDAFQNGLVRPLSFIGNLKISPESVTEFEGYVTSGMSIVIVKNPSKMYGLVHLHTYSNGIQYNYSGFANIHIRPNISISGTLYSANYTSTIKYYLLPKTNITQKIKQKLPLFQQQAEDPTSQDIALEVFAGFVEGLGYKQQQTAFISCIKGELPSIISELTPILQTIASSLDIFSDLGTLLQLYTEIKSLLKTISNCSTDIPAINELIQLFENQSFTQIGTTLVDRINEAGIDIFSIIADVAEFALYQKYFELGYTFGDILSLLLRNSL